MKAQVKFIALISLVFFLSGCSSNPEFLSWEKISSLKDQLPCESAVWLLDDVFVFCDDGQDWFLSHKQYALKTDDECNTANKRFILMGKNWIVKSTSVLGYPNFEKIQELLGGEIIDLSEYCNTSPQSEEMYPRDPQQFRPDAKALAARELSSVSRASWTDTDWETVAARNCLIIKEVIYKVSLNPNNLKLNDELWLSVDNDALNESEKWWPIAYAVTLNQEANWYRINPPTYENDAEWLAHDERLEQRPEIETKSAALCASLGVDLNWNLIPQ